MPAFTPIYFRKGTSAQWATANPVLSYGEPGYDLDEEKMKIGNGSDTWDDLDFIGGNEAVNNAPQSVANQTARLALSDAVVGDIVKQTDTGVTYALMSLPSSTNGNWLAIASPSGITVDSAITNGSANPVEGNAIFDALALKADDNAVAKLTSAQTIAGVKTFSSDPIIPDEVYGSGWNGSLEPATKNALYDKIETVVAGAGGGTDLGWIDITAAPYGASGSALETTGAITNGSPNLTLANARDFVNGQDIAIVGAGAAGAILRTSIVSGGGTTSLVLANNASTTVAGARVTHDETDIIQAAIDALKLGDGGTIYFPPGKYSHAYKLVLDNAHGITFIGDNQASVWINSPADTTPVCSVVYTGAGSGAAWEVITTQGLTWKNLCISYDNYSFTGSLMKFGATGGVYAALVTIENCKLQAWYANLLTAANIIFMPFLVWASIRNCTIYGANYLIRGFDNGTSEAPNSITLDHNVMQGGRTAFIAGIGDWWTIKDNTFEGFPFSPFGEAADQVPVCIIGGIAGVTNPAQFDFRNNQFWDNAPGANAGTTKCIVQPVGNQWAASFSNNFFDGSFHVTHFTFNGTGNLVIKENVFQKVFNTGTPVIDLGNYTTAKKTSVGIYGNGWTSASNPTTLISNKAGHDQVEIYNNSSAGWDSASECRTISGHERYGRLSNDYTPTWTNLATNVNVFDGRVLDMGGWIKVLASGGAIAPGAMFDFEFANEWIPNGSPSNAQVPLFVITPMQYGATTAENNGDYSVGAGFYVLVTAGERTKVTVCSTNGVPSGKYASFAYQCRLTG